MFRISDIVKKLTVLRQQIAALISENPKTTRAEIATAIGVATKTVERELAVISDIVRDIILRKG